jgi:hypothetical protein
VLGNNQRLMWESHQTQKSCMSKIYGFLILQEVVLPCSYYCALKAKIRWFHEDKSVDTFLVWNFVFVTAWHKILHFYTHLTDLAFWLLHFMAMLLMKTSVCINVGALDVCRYIVYIFILWIFYIFAWLLLELLPAFHANVRCLIQKYTYM